MADTFTPNLNLTNPEIGASDDTWGDKINDNNDFIDALFATSGEGTVVTRDANNDALTSGVNVTRGAGNARVIKFKSGASVRWDFGADATAESGSNTGSKFKLNRYADDGITLLGTPFTVDRDTGLVTFASTPKVGSNDVLHMGNLGNLPLPVGTPLPWLMDSLPAGFLWMNGATASRTTWAQLFAVLGTKFGVGDSVTTFGLPNWCEVVPVGRSNMGGASARGLITHLTLTDTAAAPVGEAKHVQAVGELIEHDHDVFLYEQAHDHVQNAATVYRGGGSTGDVGGSSPFNTQNGAARTATAMTGIQVRSASGGGGAQNKTAKAGASTPAGANVVQPSVACNGIIKAAA